MEKMGKSQFIALIACLAAKPYTMAENSRVKPEEKIEMVRETKDSESLPDKKKNGKMQNAFPGSSSPKNFNKKPKRNVKILITIDGGSATKKSPITKSLSEKFNLIYLESGAIFRTVSHVLLKHKMEPKIENKQKIETFLSDVSWKVSVKNRHACFVIDGEILSDKELRSDKLNARVALYSSQFESIQKFCQKVARKVLDYVKIENSDGLIAEGRTCGTQTFPEADLKFWFNASPDAKIAFRLGEEKEVDDPLNRDALDKACPFAPLKEPENAIRVWTHNRSISQNIYLTSAFIEQKLDEKNEFSKPDPKSHQ
ncbi:MAG: (d)CMP kinase [Puniceicoccales bacterium]|jgi:cytidylate kinase|nr:(d)CMP kinase [Puniceicoccales bacterium]